MTTKRMGRGLDSLMAGVQATRAKESGEPLWVDLGDLQPNSQQPRSDFGRGLEGLAESLKRHGMMQPILATPQVGGGYQILAGERRWRAAKIAGFTQVPVFVRAANPTESERLELALIENLQREDLNPIERALACRRLLDEYSLTQEQVASRLGQERSTIGNLVRLLELPDEIQAYVSRGTLTSGHARALLRYEGETAQVKAAKRVIKEGWTVRELEKEAAEAVEEAGGAEIGGSRMSRPRLPSWVVELQEKLTRRCGLRAEIRLRRKGGGRLVLHFSELGDLDRLTQTLDLPTESEVLLAQDGH
jgi:ParB family chromosome partitioning protein